MLTLAVLVLAVTATTTLVRITSTSQAHFKQNNSFLFTDDVIASLEGPITYWLEEKSSTVVLPPDITEPQVSVLNDVVDFNDQQFCISITAWDQCGLVAIDSLRGGSPLRMTIPPDVLRWVDGLNYANTSISLGWLLESQSFDDGALKIFPEALERDVVHFGDSNDELRNTANDQNSPSQALLGYVTPHTYASDTELKLNVNTAPIELLESALRLAGRGGIEQIIEARRQGESANIATSPKHDDPLSNAPEFVTQSDLWSFRVDFQSRHLQRSWWCVYRYVKSTHSNKVASESTWHCIARYVIPE